MKRLRSKPLSSLLCLLMICVFAAPAFGDHPWIDVPGDHKRDGAHQPYRSGTEPTNHIGAEAAEATNTLKLSRLDWLSAAMFEVSLYTYDLLVDNDRDQSVASEPDLRE